MEKKEVLENEAKLESHPSFLQYIAGNDWLGMPIVKMFYRDDNTDDNFQSFCKSCCKKTLNTKFTFVPVAVKSPREVEVKNRSIRGGGMQNVAFFFFLKT